MLGEVRARRLPSPSIGIRAGEVRARRLLSPSIGIRAGEVRAVHGISEKTTKIWMLMI
jgi:hypothetical protein